MYSFSPHIYYSNKTILQLYTYSSVFLPLCCAEIVTNSAYLPYLLCNITVAYDYISLDWNAYNTYICNQSQTCLTPFCAWHIIVLGEHNNELLFHCKSCCQQTLCTHSLRCQLQYVVCHIRHVPINVNNINANVHVYSLDIPMSSADCTIYIYAPGIGTHSFTVSSPLV